MLIEGLFDKMDKIEILNIPVMNEIQFKLAIKDLKLSQKNIDIAKKVYVENITRKEILFTESINQQRLSRMLIKIESNYKSQLKTNDLVSIEIITTKENVDELEQKEEKLLGKFL